MFSLTPEQKARAAAMLRERLVARFGEEKVAQLVARLKAVEAAAAPEPAPPQPAPPVLAAPVAPPVEPPKPTLKIKLPKSKKGI